MKRNHFLRCLVAAAALTSALFASADTFPSKPLRILVGYPAGGATDNLARQVAVLLGEKLGQQVIVENKAGGSTIIAAQTLIAAPADGYTLAIFEPTTVSINQSLYKKLPYDPAKSIVPVTSLSRIPFGLMVHPSNPAKNLKEFVAAAKVANPPIAFGHSGAGNAVHMSGEQLKVVAGIDMTQVPYKGGAPAVQDLMAGQLPALMMDIPSSIQQIRAGKIKILALTSAKRFDALPDVPTIAESGYPGFDFTSWFGAFVPAGTPAPVVARLNSALQEVMADPKMKEWAKGATHEIFTGSPEEFGKLIKADADQYAKILKRLNLTVDN